MDTLFERDYKLKTTRTDSPWVLVEIDAVIYAISCEAVLSLSQVPTITPLPKTPKEVRGVIDFRKRQIQLVDTRVLLNLKSTTDEINEFDTMIDQRFKDHMNWLETFERTIREDSEFTLTMDPHKCEFGKWYDNYKPKNANIHFMSIFSKFDKPHKAIHQIAAKAKELIDKRQKEEAIELINGIKHTELKQMLLIFDEIKEAYKDSSKEIVVVIGEDEHKCIGLSIDQVASIEPLFEIDEDFIKESITDTKYLSGVAKRKNGDAVFIINDEYILKNYH